MGAMSMDWQSDESLIWSLRAFDDHQRAVAFVEQFRASLCVYSSKVNQLYAKYDIVVPPEAHADLVVSPDLEAFTETWYSIPVKAVLPTGYTIMPGSMVGKPGLFLHMPFEGNRGRVVPLEAGLRVLEEEYGARGEHFLPILTKGDLRAFRQQSPMLHLHHLSCKHMPEKSQFELRDISSTIRKKLRRI